MVKIFNVFIWCNLLLLIILATSCQEEFKEVSIIDEEISIIETSNIAQLIIQISANDGSFDNIVDGSSCIAIQFPYTVQANGEQLTIETVDDLQLIEDVFDLLDSNEDTLTIDYPVNIILADYSESTINNAIELEEVAEECIENGGDDDIECIDFLYPLTIFKYDVTQQETSSVTIGADRELNLFFSDLGDEDIISLDYPVYLGMNDGTILIIYNNTELEEAIENAKNSCDEDDDNDYNDDDFTKESLDEYLMSCPWVVNDLYRDDETSGSYNGSFMVFIAENQVLLLTNDNTVETGNWYSSDSENGVLLTLEFEESQMAFNSEWLVYDLGFNTLKFYNDETNKVFLEKDCDALASPDTTAEIEAVLLSGDWQIVSFYEGDFDYTSDVNMYNFDFLNSGTVDATATDVNSYSGTWRTFDDGGLYLELYFDDFFDNLLNVNWRIVEIDESRIELRYYNVDPERVLIFEKKS